MSLFKCSALSGLVRFVLDTDDQEIITFYSDKLESVEPLNEPVPKNPLSIRHTFQKNNGEWVNLQLSVLKESDIVMTGCVLSTYFNSTIFVLRKDCPTPVFTCSQGEIQY